jgi:hypothetical protein
MGRQNVLHRQVEHLCLSHPPRQTRAEQSDHARYCAESLRSGLSTGGCTSSIRIRTILKTRRALVLALYGVTQGTGLAAMHLVEQWLITHRGWQHAWIRLGLYTLVVDHKRGVVSPWHSVQGSVCMATRMPSSHSFEALVGF